MYIIYSRLYKSTTKNIKIELVFFYFVVCDFSDIINFVSACVIWCFWITKFEVKHGLN